MKVTPNRNESGNALFLILIAVILFAALSYAITQSNRGSGAPNRETSLISSTTVTQYSSAIRTGVTRMLLRNVDVPDINFDAPTEGAFTTAAADPDLAKKELFHPDGGGVSYSPVDMNTVNAVVTTQGAKQNGNWHFVLANVSGIGTANGSGTAYDLVAMLDNVKKTICERINEQITGSVTIPTIGSASTAILADNNSLLTGSDVAGKPFLCIKSSDNYIYYHVVAEQ